MKFPLSRLLNYLATSANSKEICESLTKIGLEVESIEDFSQNLSQFSVAKIIAVSSHPDSKKLQICTVQTAESSENLKIVCGASNARVGIKVAYAKIGSIIPANQLVIKKAKIAGVESNGMLCSAYELGLGSEEESAGIIEISDEFKIGDKISEVFGKNEVVIEINITPNRGDCLGVYGIARDLAATGLGQLKQIAIPKNVVAFPFDQKIRNEHPAGFTYGCFRTIKNLRNCRSPKWLVERLESVGINSISAIVDITNLVMHELCRPMHAYDSSKIKGGLAIRSSVAGEKFTSLKNQELICDDSTILIADEEKPLSIAGIIGGISSSCTLDTDEILLEAACFDQGFISKAGRFYGINSESRQRFERGVDWQTCEMGIEMATKLIIEICGGSPSEILTIGKVVEPKIIDFNLLKISKLVGVQIVKDKVKSILENLGFVIKSELEDQHWQVVVPSYRHDIFAAEDLVEEVVRIWGYDKILKCELVGANLGGLSEFGKSSKPILGTDFSGIRSLLAKNGMQETISWSFVDSESIKLFGGVRDSLILKNPISSEMNHLRTTLALGLVSVYQRNNLRGFCDLALFEIGNVFEDQKTQKSMISGLRAGKNKPSDHYHDQRDFDVFDVKEDFLSIVEFCKISQRSLQISSDHPLPYYHPHRFAAVKLGNNLLGYFGEIHPKIAKKFDIKTRLNLFEIFVDKLPNPTKSSSYKTFIANDLQIVERDFAFLAEENLTAGELLRIVEGVDKQLIKEVELFDIFYGKNMPQGKKSLALRVKMQPLVQTMNSQQIDEISKKIIDQVQSKLGAVLRVA